MCTNRGCCRRHVRNPPFRPFADGAQCVLEGASLLRQRVLDAYRRLHEDAPREHTQVKEACCHDDEYNQRRNFGQARHVSGPAHGKGPDKGFESADDRGRNLLL